MKTKAFRVSALVAVLAISVAAVMFYMREKENEIQWGPHFMRMDRDAFQTSLGKVANGGETRINGWTRPGSV